MLQEYVLSPLMHTEAILASNIDFRGSVIQFEREALKFCGEKLTRQFSKHLELFKQIDLLLEENLTYLYERMKKTFPNRSIPDEGYSFF